MSFVNKSIFWLTNWLPRSPKTLSPLNKLSNFNRSVSIFMTKSHLSILRYSSPFFMYFEPLSLIFSLILSLWKMKIWVRSNQQYDSQFALPILAFTSPSPFSVRTPRAKLSLYFPTASIFGTSTITSTRNGSRLMRNLLIRKFVAPLALRLAQFT